MPKETDVTGQKFGRLTALERKREGKRTYYYCQCECGNELWVRADALNEQTKGCGYLSKERAKDITGEKFGKLTALEKTNERSSNGSVIWKCICECGNAKNVSLKHLTKDTTISCGCMTEPAYLNNFNKAIEKNRKENFVEGTNIHSISRTAPKSNNTSGVPGVTWVKNRKKWSARITFQGKTYNLGTFVNKESAIQVRKEAEDKIFGEFLEWYFARKQKEHTSSKEIE